MFYTYTDIITGNKIVIDFEQIKSIIADSKEKKSKDNFGNNVEGFSVIQYRIVFKLEKDFHEVQAFENEKERDKVFEKVQKDWLKSKKTEVK